jgi:hypothetical protein
MTRAGAGAGGWLAQPVLVRRMLIGCYVLWKFKRMMDKTRDGKIKHAGSKPPKSQLFGYKYSDRT